MVMSPDGDLAASPGTDEGWYTLVLVYWLLNVSAETYSRDTPLSSGVALARFASSAVVIGE